MLVDRNLNFVVVLPSFFSFCFFFFLLSFLLLLLLLMHLLLFLFLLFLLLLMIIIKKTCFIFCVFSAVKGVTYVIHVASPFPSSQPKDENEVIQPAVEGTQSVLKACVATKTVKRIVLTSSCVAVNCKYA